MHDAIVRIRPRPSFDLGRTVSVACASAPMAGEQDAGEGRYTKALVVDREIVVVTVMEHAGALELSMTSARPLDPARVDRVASRVRFVLSLDDDLGPFVAQARADAAFAPVERALHGFHHLKFPSALETACRAVLARRTPMPLARRHERELIDRYGHVLELGDRVWRAFPDAERLASVPVRELARVVPDPRKATYLHELARAFAPIDADAHLRGLPFDEAARWLRALPGMGPWSTAFVLFRGLGRMERASLEGPLLECARRVYGARSIPELERVAASYGEAVGYWALYLRAGVRAGARPLRSRAA